MGEEGSAVVAVTAEGPVAVAVASTTAALVTAAPWEELEPPLPRCMGDCCSFSGARPPSRGCTPLGLRIPVFKGEISGLRGIKFMFSGALRVLVLIPVTLK